MFRSLIVFQFDHIAEHFSSLPTVSSHLRIFCSRDITVLCVLFENMCGCLKCYVNLLNT